MPTSKWSPMLRQTASSAAPGESLHVVVELKERSATPPATASLAERRQMNKQSFALETQPLKEKIAQLGGEVLDEAWLNSTISVRMPKKALEELSFDDLVQSIDLPRTLERE